MGYGDELFDKFDAISGRTGDALESLRRTGEFLNDLANAYEKFGKSVQKLSKSYGKKFTKKNVEQGTNRDAWDTFLSETEVMGGAFLAAATNLSSTCAGTLLAFCKAKEKARKQLLGEAGKLTKHLESGYSNLESCRSKSHKLAKGAASALAAYEKASSDPGQNPVQVDKLLSKSQTATGKARQQDEEYANLCNATNTMQRDFYESLFPRVLNDLELLDRERIDQLYTSLSTALDIQRQMIPQMENSFTSIEMSVNSISVDDDVQLFIDANVSGASHPAEIPYEPAPFLVEQGIMSSIPTGGTSTAPPASARPASVNNSAGSRKSKGPSGGDQAMVTASARKDVSAMSPQQLEERLAEIDEEIVTTVTTRKGIETLIDVYPDGSDAKDQVLQQIEDCNVAVDELTSQKEEIEAILFGDGAYADDQVYIPDDNAPVLFQAEAMYDYQAEGEGELNFYEGDVIDIIEEDDSGWWMGRLNGATGLAPSNYLERI